MEKTIILIFEKDLEDRYNFFTERFGIQTVKFNLQNIYGASFYEILYRRIKYLKIINKKYREHYCDFKDADNLFISNYEGFVARNIIENIRRDMPEKNIIALQHGLINLNKNSLYKKIAIKIADFFSKKLFGMFVCGNGWINNGLEKAIVYNKIYQKHLIECGWLTQNVLISSYMLKGFQFSESKEIDIKKLNTKRNALFLLQCLSKGGRATKENECEIIKNVIYKLSHNHDKVYVRQHPYCQIDIDDMPENCLQVDGDLQQQIKQSDLVVSFFSTALLEFENLGVPSVAIKSKKIKLDEAEYDVFKYIHYYDNHMHDEDFIYSKNKKRASVENFMEVGALEFPDNFIIK